MAISKLEFPTPEFPNLLSKLDIYFKIRARSVAYMVLWRIGKCEVVQP